MSELRNATEIRYTIGELAQTADVPISTVRYYEKVGIVKPDGRTMGNYRYYGHDTLEKLRFIRAAQGTGFALEDIASLLELRESVDPCREVEVLIEERLDEVERRLEHLQHLQRVLRNALELCRAGEDDRRCQVIAKINVKSKRPRRKRPRRSEPGA